MLGVMCLTNRLLILVSTQPGVCVCIMHCNIDALYIMLSFNKSSLIYIMLAYDNRQVLVVHLEG